MRGQGSGMSSAKRVVRRVLGLSVDGATRPARPKGRKGPEAPEPAANPWVRAGAGAVADHGSVSDFELGAVEGRGSAAVGRWLVRGLLVLLIVIGAWTAFIRPIVSRGGDTAPTQVSLDQAAAEGVAERYALDYLSWSPGSDNRGRAAALAAVTAGGAETSAPAWSGSGYLDASDAVIVGVRSLANRSGIVTIDVRVSIAVPGKGTAPLSPPAPSAAGAATASAGMPAAQATGIPTGYRLQSTLWLRIAVPVVQTGPDVRIAPSGPVFVGERLPAPVAAAEDSATDQASTADTTEWVKTFMTAYAVSDAEYQTADGSSLTGLAGAVKVSAVGSWTVRVPDAAGVRVGSAAVTWQLAGADLSISQSYTIGVTQSAQRWYATTVGPVNPVGEETTTS